MNPDGLVDRVLATLAMLGTIRPLSAGLIGSAGRLSPKRMAAYLAGGAAALAACVGLLVLRSLLLRQPNLTLPTWWGGTLACFGGMLGMTTLLAPRGLTEDRAIRRATLAVGMAVYLASPAVALGGLGLTRLARAWLFPTKASGRRWMRVLEGLVLLALAAVPRDPDLGGLRRLVTFPGMG